MRGPVMRSGMAQSLHTCPSCRLPAVVRQRGGHGRQSPPEAGSEQFITSAQQGGSRQSSGAHAPGQQRAPQRQQYEPGPKKLPLQVEMVDARRQHAPQNPAQPLIYATTFFAGATLVVAVVRFAQRFTSPEEKHLRDVDKNKFLVETLSKYLPNNRMALDSGVVRQVRRQTGFGNPEIFRKFLWFLLRERKFDQSAVDDMILLKSAFGLTDEEVAGAIHERAQRIYERYGNVMLEVKGMTKAGIDRKATCRALFSKLLYLQECEQLLAPDGPALQHADVPGVFGATEDDTASLRIVSLQEVDFDSLEAQFRDQ